MLRESEIPVYPLSSPRDRLVALLGVFVIGVSIGAAICSVIKTQVVFVPAPDSPAFVQMIKPNVDRLIEEPSTRKAFVDNTMTIIGEDQLKLFIFRTMLDLKPELNQRPALKSTIRKYIGVNE